MLHAVDCNFPEDGTPEMLETLAERLAQATEEGLMIVDVDAAQLPADWNWEGVVNGKYGTSNSAETEEQLVETRPMVRNVGPLAAHPYKSYRYPNRYGGWIMIGARTTAEAVTQGQRSTSLAVTSDMMQVWDGAAWAQAVVQP
jgi:hypothetical protein